MKEYKHSKLVIGVLFWGGLIFSYFALGKADTLSLLIAIAIFMLTGMFIGKEMVYEEYNNLHYSALEDDAKKRRKKDEELSKKVHDEYLQYEKDHPENK